MSKPGHNSTDNRLKSLADRIERLMDERDGIQGDIRDIYAEAKSAGYVPKVLRKAITRKRMDPSKRDEEDTILDLYEGALTGPMKRAVEMAAKGASARQIETETGIDQATVARSVSLNKKSETQESCGSSEPDIASELAPGPHDAITEEAVERAFFKSVEIVSTGGPGDGNSASGPADEAPAPPSVGAVAAEPRVAPQTDLEMPPIPSHLRSRTAQGGSV